MGTILPFALLDATAALRGGGRCEGLVLLRPELGGVAGRIAQQLVVRAGLHHAAVAEHLAYISTPINDIITGK